MDGDDGVLENRKGLSDGRDGMDTLSVLCTDRRLTAEPSLCSCCLVLSHDPPRLRWYLIAR
jgi:hypothetical protein